MAVTNVKSTFLAKLLGQTNDKKNLPEEGMPMANPAAGANPGLRFQAPNPLFGPSGIGATAAPVAAPQPQRSRYNLFEQIQPQPVRDAESEEIIKRRAKVNALGAGISGLAGLASMATGGDVPQPVDLVTPWNMDETRIMDRDYRGRLQNWIDQGFQVDQANTSLMNREVDQTIDAENRMAQINQQGQNQQALAEQRAQYALQQLQAKSKTEQMQEMMRMGIDPNQADAYGKYLEANRNKFKTELDYTKAQTNWNNRAPKGGTSSTSGQGLPYSLDTLKKGRDARISQLEAQKAEALKTALGSSEKQQVEKYYNEMIAEERKYKPGANPLIDADIAELGYQMEENEMGGGPDGTQQGGAMEPSMEMIPYLPGSGLTMGQERQQSSTVAEDPARTERITAGLQRIANREASDEDFEAILQDIVDAGEAETLQDAANLVYKLIKGGDQ